MLIIVEGSNKVGKSTIISKLKKLHNVSTIYNRDILKEMVDVKQEAYISAIAMLDVIKCLSEKENIILDRFHLSEHIYGFLNRNYNNEELFEKVDKELSEMNCLLIVVTSDYEHFVERIPSGHKYREIQKAFKQMYHASKIKDKLMIRLEEIQ